MNRSELIEEMSARTLEPKNQSAMLLEVILDCITKGLETDGRVNLVRFGVFQVRKRRAKRIREPKGGKLVMTSSINVVRFSPGTELEKKVNDE